MRIRIFDNFIHSKNGRSVSVFLVLFTSAKGGVGKSTLAVNFEYFMRVKGESVTLVDADPNGHLHGASFLSRAEVATSLPQKNETAEGALKRTLAGLSASWAVVDSKPAMELGERFAVNLADLVIVPTLPGIGEARATLEVVRIAKGVRDSHGDGFPRIAIAPNCWDKGREAVAAMETLRASGEAVLPPIFCRNTVRAAMREKGTVYGSRGVVAKEMQAAFMAALNLFSGEEINERLQ